MTALYPTLLTIWLPVLIGVPVLIHLINLLRHRRVRWAAMEFLLESKKKNQNWIRFKEILLLLARMAAVAAVVLLMAGLILSDRWSRLFSGGLVHHVLLVDDSLSMSDQWDNRSAIQNARGVVEHLLDRAAHQQGTQLVTLLRFSDAAAGRGPDVVRQSVRQDQPQQRQALLDLVRPSQLAAGPREALKAVKEKIGVQKNENLVVYLISDFRSPQWRDAKGVTDVMRELTDDKARLQLVRCVDKARPNLAITGLSPDDGIRAADVPLRMKVSVTNFDTAPARNVQVLLECQTNAGETATATRQALPAVTFEPIAPGQTAHQHFSAQFPTAGDHEISARLANDALTADNERFCVVHLPAEVPVLIVDGRPGSIEGQLLSLPKGGRTGLNRQIVGVNYLREQPLDKFAEVMLVNIGALDAAEGAALESYVAGGGHIVFFAGESTRADVVNETLYRGGKGFFPLPLVSQASLVVDRLDQAPDIDVDLTHPVLRRTFAGTRNSMLRTLFVERHFAAPKDWRPSAADGVRVLARLRNQAPLIVERRFGQGSCIAFLTTANQQWNNISSTFLFVTLMMDLHAYLTSGHAAQPEHEVGQPITIDFDKSQYAAEVQFSRPKQKGSQQVSVQATPVTAGGERLKATFNKTGERGIYEARLARTDGAAETRRYAANVPPGEGDLAVLSSAELQTALGGIEADIHESADFSGPVTQQAGLNLGVHWLLFAVILAMLVGEQVLAYSASYHPAPSQRRG